MDFDQIRNKLREEVSILDLLIHYGYRVHPGGGDREQQFSCDLHGDGRDGRPSARVYPASGSFYCFACSKSRDVIELVRAKEDLGFWQAVRFLERMFSLTPLENRFEPPAGSLIPQETSRELDQSMSFSRMRQRVENYLLSLTVDRSVSKDKILRLWETLDHLVFQVEGRHGKPGALSESRGVKELEQLLQEAKCDITG